MTPAQPNSNIAQEDGRDLEGRRVLRVVTQASRTGRYGGPFDTALNQSRLLSDLGAQVEVLALHIRGDEPPQARRLDGVQYRYVRGTYLGRAHPAILVSLRAVPEIFRAVRASDVVHVSFAREYLPLVATALAIAERKPLILQPHGMIRRKRGWHWRCFDWAVTRRLLSQANVLVTLTEIEASQLGEVGYGTEPIVYAIGNPVLRPNDEARLVGSMGGRPEEVLFVARLHRRKRVDVFCDAARLASERGLRGNYVVVGPAAGDEGHVATATQQLGDRLIYEGAVAGGAVSARVGLASVFVLTSSDEPWGNVLVSALAQGVAVVLSESSALAPELSAKQAAVVVPDGDALAVALAVDDLLRDEEYRTKISAAAQRFARDRVSDDAIRDSLSAAYTDALHAGTVQC